VRRHGADAPIVAVQRADELFNEGDLDGAAVRKHILHAVRGVAAGEAEGGRKGELDSRLAPQRIIKIDGLA